MADEALRFVIQRHEREPDPHFDIMLEREGRLRTWSAPGPPGSGSPEARSLSHHRIAYLEYEGEISGGRGWVRIWDRGTYRPRVWEEQQVVVDLSGTRLRGRLSLSLIGEDRWTLEWTPGPLQ